MNSVTLVGTLTRDPELKDRDEMMVCDLRVADNNAQDDSPLYIDVSVFRRQAEVCGEFLSKGRQIAVTGQLRYSEWETRDGAKRSDYSITADRVDFLSSGGRPDKDDDDADEEPEDRRESRGRRRERSSRRS